MIDYVAIVQLISVRYRFLKRPSEAEINEILARLRLLQSKGVTVTEQHLDEIVYACVKDTTAIVLDSLDMSATVSVLRQLLAAAELQAKK